MIILHAYASNIHLEYPIIQNKIYEKKQKMEIRITLYSIPELLTYDRFMAQIRKQDAKLDF